MGIWIDFRRVPQGFLSQSLTTQIVIDKTLQIIRYGNSIRFINLYSASSIQISIVQVYKIIYNLYKKLYKIYV